jgi:hypothetical protein
MKKRNEMRIDRERMIFDAMKVVARVLNGAFVIERKNPIRQPTVKELAKHPKLLRKQRRKSMGEQ